MYMALGYLEQCSIWRIVLYPEKVLPLNVVCQYTILISDFNRLCYFYKDKLLITMLNVIT